MCGGDCTVTALAVQLQVTAGRRVQRTPSCTAAFPLSSWTEFMPFLRALWNGMHLR